MIVLLGACATRTEIIRLGPSPALTPISTDSVRVFISPDRVPGPYTEVAIISSHETGLTPVNEQKIIEVMREEAGKLGANGIILGGPAVGGENREVNVKVNQWQPTRGRSVAIYIKP